MSQTFTRTTLSGILFLGALMLAIAVPQCSARCAKIHLSVVTRIIGADLLTVESESIAIETCTDTSFADVKSRILLALGVHSTDMPTAELYAVRGNIKLGYKKLVGNSVFDLWQPEFTKLKSMSAFVTEGTLIGCFADPSSPYYNRQHQSDACEYNAPLYLVKSSKDLLRFANAHLSWMLGRFGDGSGTSCRATSPSSDAPFDPTHLLDENKRDHLAETEDKCQLPSRGDNLDTGPAIARYRIGVPLESITIENQEKEPKIVTTYPPPAKTMLCGETEAA